LTFIEKETKIMETKNARKQLKTSQNIFKIVCCIENANIKLHVFTTICFRVTPNTKIDFVKNQFCLRIPVLP